LFFYFTSSKLITSYIYDEFANVLYIAFIFDDPYIMSPAQASCFYNRICFHFGWAGNPRPGAHVWLYGKQLVVDRVARCRLRLASPRLAPPDLVAALCRVCSSLVLVGAVSPTPPSATSPPPPAPALLRDAVRLRNLITSPSLSPPPPGRKSSPS
jgi:hypothetical protein